MNSESLGRVLLILFSVLAVVCVEEKSTDDELFLEDGMAPLWLICTSEASTLEIPYDLVISDKRLSQLKEKIHIFGSKLGPETRDTLRLCLLHYISELESRKVNWYDHYISYIFHNNVFSDTYGHTLSRKLLEGPSPSPLPSINGNPLLSSSPSPSAPPPFFKKFNDSTEQNSVNSGRTSNVGGSQQSQRHDSSRVVVAVVVTAAVTFVIVGLMLLCYRKCCYGSGGLNHNDERPLLNLSMSDFSVGSLHISFGNSPSSRKNSFSVKNSSETPSPSDHSFYRTKLPSMIIDRPGRVNGRLQPPLKPPPGRIGTFSQEKLSPNPVSHVLNSHVSSVSKVEAARPPPPPPPMAPSPPLAPIPPRPLKPSGSSRPPLPPPPPAVSNAMKSGFQPPPPPPPQKGKPPPPLPPMKPLFAKGAQNSASGSTTNQSDAGYGDEDGQKTKLKPFFWDKVLASPDQSMVWHQIKSGSFQFNEEMIESLFGYTSAANKDKGGQKKDVFSQDPSTLSIQIIDHKKAQNLSILLRALNVTTEEVCDALHEGNELPSELVETLLRVAPTPEEELKLRLFDGELSLISPGERFLKILVNIPFAFRRLESLLFVHSLHEEISTIKYSFSTLEVACKELRSSRLFLKLLEAVLKTGNRMNDGTFRGGAQAFKLDTLLKLSDVKGTDGKTTLLHFVVQEIIRSEGIRASRVARENSISSVKSEDIMEGTNSNNESEETYRSIGLQVVSGLSSELENVKKVAALDAESLSGNVAKLGRGLARVNDFLKSDMKTLDEDTQFRKTLESFTEHAHIDISWLSDEEKRIIALVKSTADYFHGNPGKDEGLRLFVIVRDFLVILDKVCKEVRESQRKSTRQPIKPTSSHQPFSEELKPSLPADLRTLVFPAVTDRRVNEHDSDEDSP